MARVADAAVVGTALVDKLAAGLNDRGVPLPGLVEGVLGMVRDLADGVRGARVGG